MCKTHRARTGGASHSSASQSRADGLYEDGHGGDEDGHQGDDYGHDDDEYERDDDEY